MRIQKVEFNLGLDGGEGRSEGLHVSEIIRSVAFRIGALDKKWEHADMDAPTVNLGLAWEDWYFKQHPNVIHQPGELKVDGVYLTMDGLAVDGDHSFIRIDRREDCIPVVHECKTTKKSAPKTDDELLGDKFWIWMSQIKAYCWAVETPYARLHALFINGRYDWVKGGTTLPLIWDLEFTEGELRKNWDMLMIHRREMKG